jgi:hypothetical protein
VTTPPEDLVIAARQLDPKVFDVIDRARWDDDNDDALLDWRLYVPRELRKLWGRLGLEARLAVYITAKRMFDEPGDE